MADSYDLTGTITAVTAPPGDTALNVLASALLRAEVLFFSAEVGGVPVGDNVLTWLLRRVTADGTGTLITYASPDPSAPAHQLTAREQYTAEPTFGQQLWSRAVHQRNSYNWYPPAGRRGFLIPATAGFGLAWTPTNPVYNGTAQVSVEYLE